MATGIGNDTLIYTRDGSTVSESEFGTIYFSAPLDGTQSGVTTSASGTATATLNKAQTRFELTASISGLDLDGAQTASTADNVTGIHIHRAPAGSGGGVVFGIKGGGGDLNGDNIVDGPGNSFFAGWDELEGNAGTTLTAELPNLLADGLYVNVHTTTNPGGEIRGQILKLDDGDDRIDVSALNVTTFDALEQVISDNGSGDAVLETFMDGVSTKLTLTGVSSADLDAGDFIFATAGTGEKTKGGLLDDDMFGGGGNDDLIGRAGDDRLFGETGNDTLRGGEGADHIDGGIGSVDYVDYRGSLAGVTVNLNTNAVSGGDATGDTIIRVEGIIGSSEDDDLTGNAAANRINGGAGNDTLNGEGGNDIIDGGGGDDTIDGGAGNNVLRGRSGDDSIIGGSGVDTVSGGTGNDTIDAGGGNDNILGQGNDDVLSGGDGADTLSGGAGNDTLNGGSGADTLFGQGNDDVLNGDEGNDLLQSAAGADVLNGGSGNDTLRGGDGFDTLDGGTGDDVLAGGSDADRFVFFDGGNADTITDFGDNEDTLALDEMLWSGSLTEAQVVAMFASQDGANVVFDFGGGDTIQVNNITTAAIENDIEFFTMF